MHRVLEFKPTPKLSKILEGLEHNTVKALRDKFTSAEVEQIEQELSELAGDGDEPETP